MFLRLLRTGCRGKQYNADLDSRHTQIQIVRVAGATQSARRSRNTKAGFVACPASQIAIWDQLSAIKYYNSALLCALLFTGAIKTYDTFCAPFKSRALYLKLRFNRRKSGFCPSQFTNCFVMMWSLVCMEKLVLMVYLCVLTLVFMKWNRRELLWSVAISGQPWDILQLRSFFNWLLAF